MKFFLGIIRAKFLILSVSCVFLALGLSVYTTHTPFNWEPLTLILVFVGAVCSHAAVNALNEYQDFKTGLDFETIKTPFSGGSGTLPAHPKKAKTALYIGIALTLLTLAIGIYIGLAVNPQLFILGAIGLVTVVVYPFLSVKQPLLSLLTPGLGYGICMVLGANLAFRTPLLELNYWVALIPFFLTNNLLLVNQFPDKEVDAKFGRSNSVILKGVAYSTVLVGLFYLFPILIIIGLVITQQIPLSALLALLPFLLLIKSVPAFQTYIKTNTIEDLLPAMGNNVLINLLVPFILGLVLLLIK